MTARRLNFVRPGTLGHVDVTILIRARNEARHIGLTLDALLCQEWPVRAEIVLVDSGSTDGTLEIAARYPVRVVSIGEFTYSSALNRGFEEARAALVAPLSAHAVPTDGTWLWSLRQAIEEPRAAAAYSREVPWPDADPEERWRLERDFPPWRAVRGLDLALEPGDKKRPGLYAFSNAAALIRRDLWKQRPFRELPYAEDMDWARWALETGYRIVYEPRARVRHSHRDSLLVRTGREVRARRAMAQIFEYRPSFVKEVLGQTKAGLALALRAVAEKGRFLEKVVWAARGLAKPAAFAWMWARTPAAKLRTPPGAGAAPGAGVGTGAGTQKDENPLVTDPVVTK